MSGCSIGHGVIGKQPVLITGGTVDISGSHFATVCSDALASLEVQGGVLTMSGTKMHEYGAANTVPPLSVRRDGERCRMFICADTKCDF